MALFSFADGAAVFDSTPIENIFLIDYLPTAPDEYLRVYLYARMLALHPELGADIAAMAAALRLDEEAILNAFAYWEQQGLARRLSDRPPAFQLLPLRSSASPAAAPMDRAYYEYRDFNADLQNLFGKKLMHPQEYVMANDWLNLLGFDQEAVLYAVAMEIRAGRSKEPDPARVFKRLNKRMLAWADRGIRTRADLERELRYDGEVRNTAKAVLKRFSLRRKPTEDELECARRWLGEWALTPEAVLSACEETTKSRSPSFAYLDAILKSRREGDGPLRAELVEALRELDPLNAQPTPDLMSRYGALRAQGFEAETVKLAAVQCRRKKKTSFGEVEWMLNKWRERGLFTAAAAAEYISVMQRKTASVRALLERAGLERRPTMDDLARYDAWLERSGEDVILYAAECARGMQLPMLYMDKLLSEWQSAGATTLEAAKASRAAHAASEKKTASGAPANPALDYEQRDYKGEEVGADFFIDLDQYGSDGEGDDRP